MNVDIFLASMDAILAEVRQRTEGKVWELEELPKELQGPYLWAEEMVDGLFEALVMKDENDVMIWIEKITEGDF